MANRVNDPPLKDTDFLLDLIEAIASTIQYTEGINIRKKRNSEILIIEILGKIKFRGSREQLKMSNITDYPVRHNSDNSFILRVRSQY